MHTCIQTDRHGRREGETFCDVSGLHEAEYTFLDMFAKPVLTEEEHHDWLSGKGDFWVSLVKRRGREQLKNLLT